MTHKQDNSWQMCFPIACTNFTQTVVVAIKHMINSASTVVLSNLRRYCFSGGASAERNCPKPGSSKWRFAALRFVHSQDTREIRGPNAFKTRLKCTCHEIALSVTRQTCTWNCPAEKNRSFGKGIRRSKNQWRTAPFHWMGCRHSVNEGIGKEFYRKGNSLKRFRPFSESLDSKYWNFLRSSPSQISTPTEKCQISKRNVIIWFRTQFKTHRVLQGVPPRGAQLYFSFSSAPDPLFKASKAPFLTFRVATPSGAPRQAPLEKLLSLPRILQASPCQCFIWMLHACRV